MSEDGSVMRPLLLPGLLDAARHNAAHGAGGLALFESAHVYRPAARSTRRRAAPRAPRPRTERHHLAGCSCREPRRLAQLAPWRTSTPPRAWSRPLFGAAGLELACRSPARRPFLHPGRTAECPWRAMAQVGWIGELHPLVAREWDLDGAAAFELDFDALAEAAPGPAAYADVTRFPAVLQDIAVIVARDVSAAPR